MTIYGYTLPELKKSVVAFATPGVVALIAALAPESAGGMTVTSTELVGIVVAMLGTGWLVFAVKNAATPPAAVVPPVV